MFGNTKQTQATVLSMNAKLIALLKWGMTLSYMTYYEFPQNMSLFSVLDRLSLLTLETLKIWNIVCIKSVFH